MTLRECIFPPDAARDGHILRLGLVGSWESQLIGLGRMTAFVTSRMLRQSHAVDDMGLNVVFLQRHRVEVGLKLLLERTESQIPPRHGIQHLVERCVGAFRGGGLAGDWNAFHASQREFIDLMHEVDPGGATHRYPVDQRGQTWSRSRFVDMQELETAGRSFEDAVLDLTSMLAFREPLPVARTEAFDVARDLREFATACRVAIARNRQILAELRAESDRLAAVGGREIQREVADADLAAEEVGAVTLALADRAAQMGQRIVAAYDLQLLPEPEEGKSASLPPLMLSPDPRALRAQWEAQIRWWSDESGKCFRRIGNVLYAVRSHAAGWSTPAARQLHLDIERFGSRFFTNWDVPSIG